MGKKELKKGPLAAARNPAPSPAAERPSLDTPLSPWEDEIEGWFADFRRHLRLPRLSSERGSGTDQELVRPPVVDVYEKDKSVIVKAEIPGMAKENIEVTASESTLTIRGEKKKEEDVNDGDYHRCERSFGSFLRRIELPSAVEARQAVASFKNGVLEVRLPRAAQAQQRAIPVAVK